jgi:hypothetical protein
MVDENAEEARLRHKPKAIVSHAIEYRGCRIVRGGRRIVSIAFTDIKLYLQNSTGTL